MFSTQQKREIADAVQKILRATNHPELSAGEINFALHVDGAESWSWADIRNNGGVTQPGVNPWNEAQDPRTAKSSNVVLHRIVRLVLIYSSGSGTVGKCSLRSVTISDSRENCTA